MVRYYCDRCGREIGNVVDRVRVARRILNLDGTDDRMEYGAPGAHVTHRDFCSSCADHVWAMATDALTVTEKESIQ